MKKWKEVSPYTGESVEIDEDAPANSVAGGGVSMPPDAVHDKKKRKMGTAASLVSSDDNKLPHF